MSTPTLGSTAVVAAAAIAAAFAGVTSVAHAQDAGNAVAALKQDQRNFTLDLTPPDLSAFALLGTNPTEVARPGTVRELAAAVASGISTTGQITPGVALEWAPGQTFGAAASLDEYRRTALWRRLSVSAATVADGPAVRTAAGLRWVVKDESDPRTNLALSNQIEAELATLGTEAERTQQNQSIARQLADIYGGERAGSLLRDFFSSNPPPEVIPSRDAHCRRLTKTIEAGGSPVDADRGKLLCDLVDRYIQILHAERAAKAGLSVAQARLRQRLQAFREAAWNADAFEVALGATGIAADGSWQSLEPESLRAYADMAMGGGSHFLGIMRGDFGRHLNGPDRWSAALGLRGLLGTPDGRGTVEIVGRFAENSPDTMRMAVGGEIRVGPALWLELLVGDDAALDDFDQGRMVFKANLKYGQPQHVPVSSP